MKPPEVCPSCGLEIKKPKKPKVRLIDGKWVEQPPPPHECKSGKDV